jgi:hypothetical protein
LPRNSERLESQREGEFSVAGGDGGVEAFFDELESVGDGALVNFELTGGLGGVLAAGEVDAQGVPEGCPSRGRCVEALELVSEEVLGPL